MKEKCSATSPADFLKPEVVLHAFRHRATSVLIRVGTLLAKKQASGLTSNQAWEESTVDLVQASEAHAWLVLLRGFSSFIADCSRPSLKAPMLQMFSLLACDVLERLGIELLEDGYLSTAQLNMIREQSRKCLHMLRPNAVALVDAWDFSDCFLNSALGRYDGNVYEALYEMAQRNPLNKTEILPGFKENILPIIRGKL